MRWVVRIVVGLLVAVLLMAAAAWWWLEREARGPALAEGMWWSTDCCNVDSAYDERLRQLFLGRSEADLRTELQRQRFELRGPRSASAQWSDFACGYFANVEWTLDDRRRVTAIWGDVGSSCL